MQARRAQHPVEWTSSDVEIAVGQQADECGYSSYPQEDVQGRAEQIQRNLAEDDLEKRIDEGSPSAGSPATDRFVVSGRR